MTGNDSNTSFLNNQPAHNKDIPTNKEKLIQQYPYLLIVDKKNEYISSLITAAKNIRIELKKAFPNIKFSVTTQRYAGGNSIDVSWTGDVSRKNVKDITDKYLYGEFNGMIDGYDYKKDRSFNDIFGGSDYVFLHSSIKHPQLIKGDDALTVAKNIEIELKTFFPSTVFKISIEKCTLPKLEHYDQIVVSWKDGVDSVMVKKVTTKYELSEYTPEAHIPTLKKDRAFNEIHGGAAAVYIRRYVTFNYLTRSQMLEMGKEYAKFLASTLNYTYTGICKNCAEKEEKILEWKGNYYQQLHSKTHLLYEIVDIVKKEAGEELANKIEELIWERRDNPHVLVNIRAFLGSVGYPMNGTGSCFYDELTEDEKQFVAKKTIY